MSSLTRSDETSGETRVCSGACRFIWPVYIALVSLAWLVNYPGRLSSDTVDMLIQSQHPETLNDLHAPLITWIYSLFAPVFGQPAGALAVQALFMFFYWAIVPATRLGDRRTSIAESAIFAATAVFVVALVAIAGQVLKDTVLIGAILSLLGVIELGAGSFHKKRWRGALFALLVVILYARATNFLMLGCAAAICAYFVFGVTQRFFLSLLVIVLVCGASLPAGTYLNRKILSARDAGMERTLIIFDTAGISTNSRQNLFASLPSWPAKKLQMPWECYTPKGFDVFRWGVCGRYDELFETAMKQPGAPSEREWWFSNIFHHPDAYARHRASYVIELFKNERPIIGWNPPYARNSQDHMNEPMPVTYGYNMNESLRMWEPTVAYLPFGWAAARLFARPASMITGLLLCIGTLAWSWHMRRTRKKYDFTTVLCSALGLGNVVMLAAFGVGEDARYLAPTLVCGIVSLLRILQSALDARQVNAEGPN